jgi:hypothetical protein
MPYRTGPTLALTPLDMTPFPAVTRSALRVSSPADRSTVSRRKIKRSVWALIIVPAARKPEVEAIIAGRPRVWAALVRLKPRHSVRKARTSTGTMIKTGRGHGHRPGGVSLVKGPASRAWRTKPAEITTVRQFRLVGEHALQPLVLGQGFLLGGPLLLRCCSVSTASAVNSLSSSSQMPP